MKARRLALSCLVMALASQALLAQATLRDIEQPSAELMRSIVQSLGAEKLGKYAFVPRPNCPKADVRAACTSHGAAAIPRLRASQSETKPEPRRDARSSPLQRWNGKWTIVVSREINDIEPGYMGTDAWQLEISEDKKRVVSKKLLGSELTVMPRR